MHFYEEERFNRKLLQNNFVYKHCFAGIDNFLENCGATTKSAILCQLANFI